MNMIAFQKVSPVDIKAIELIAEWYLSEWTIPKEATFKRLAEHPVEGIPFQLLMTLDGLPVATGGIYQQVGISDVDPKYRKYSPWLALVFTTPAMRNLGYATLLCEHIELIAKEMAQSKLYLFTHTAEKLYTKLNWRVIDRVSLKGKNTVVMEKDI